MGVEVVGITALRAKIRKTGGSVQTELARHIARNEVPKLARDMKSTAGRYGRLARAAAKTLETEPVKGGAQVSGGGGTSLGGKVFYGAEFGGQKRRSTYSRRSRRGLVHVVSRRRSTMQFHPHLGKRGYWFWPTVRKDLKDLDERLADVLERAWRRG